MLRSSWVLVLLSLGVAFSDWQKSSHSIPTLCSKEPEFKNLQLTRVRQIFKWASVNKMWWKAAIHSHGLSEGMFEL